MANLRIKLVKSLSGRLEKHIATANSLGLHKIGGAGRRLPRQDRGRDQGLRRS